MSNVHNIIYERAKFNKRCQEVGASADNFITAVHKLAEHWKYGCLREEMIRDKIVVGIRDEKLSEKLQLNPKLDLATAIVQGRQHEDVKMQQVIVRAAESQSYNSKRQANRKKPAQCGSYTQHQPALAKPIQCGRCGKTPKHSWTECPAKDVECRKCHKKGHFVNVCRSIQKLDSIEEDGAAAYLGAVSFALKWTQVPL